MVVEDQYCLRHKCIVQKSTSPQYVSYGDIRRDYQERSALTRDVGPTEGKVKVR